MIKVKSLTTIHSSIKAPRRDSTSGLHTSSASASLGTNSTNLFTGRSKLLTGPFHLPSADTHVQYTQTDTNRQETLTNGTIGKKSSFVKEAFRFALLVRMEISSVHRYTICKLHLITTSEPCVSDLSIGIIGSIRFHWKSS